MNNEEIKKYCERAFATHKATLLQDTDRYCIIDWCRADGSGNCYVNYIVDKKRGSLIVSGDLGDSIETWFNAVTPAKLKGYIYNDVDYYISKFQCASDQYTQNEDDVMEDIKSYIDDDELWDAFSESERCGFDTPEEMWEAVEDEVSSCIYGNKFIPSDRLSNLFPESWEWLSDCGKRTALRCYMWAEGFYMACEQLGIGGA